MQLHEKGSFVHHFSRIEDPRIERHKLYPIIEILFLVVCANICGADSWRDYVIFGNAKIDYLRKYFPYAQGIPTKSTIALVFSLLNPKTFKQCFIEWIKSMQANVEGVLAIDGKTLRHSFDKEKDQSPIHMVSAFSHSAKLVLGQEKVAEKSNEITAIPKLLSVLELRGSIVTIDAMGCQKAIAEQIINQGGNYILGLKGNQGTLHKDVELFLNEEVKENIENCLLDFHEEIDGGHGRIESRKCYVSSKVNWLDQREEWRGLRTLIMIESTREIKGERKKSKEKRFYISSVQAKAKDILESIRAHWCVENQLHWVLDVSFNEDSSRVRKDHAPENMSMIRHIVLNMIRSTKKGVNKDLSIKGLRKKAGWDSNTLTNIIKQSF